MCMCLQLFLLIGRFLTLFVWGQNLNPLSFDVISQGLGCSCEVDQNARSKLPRCERTMNSQETSRAQIKSVRGRSASDSCDRRKIKQMDGDVRLPGGHVT